MSRGGMGRRAGRSMIGGRNCGGGTCRARESGGPADACGVGCRGRGCQGRDARGGDGCDQRGDRCRQCRDPRWCRCRRGSVDTVNPGGPDLDVMMLGQGGPVKGYVATRPVDFRNGVDGLVLAVQEVLGLNPFCGAVFVFRAKRAVFRPFNCGSASSLFLSVPGSWSLSRSWPHVYVRVRYLNVCSAGAFEACSRNNDVTATTVPADIAGLASGLQSRGRVKRKSCRHLFPHSKTVPSTQIQWRIAASFRATATWAFFMPLRLARRSSLRRSAGRPPSGQVPHDLQSRPDAPGSTRRR